MQEFLDFLRVHTADASFAGDDLSEFFQKKSCVNIAALSGIDRESVAFVCKCQASRIKDHLLRDKINSYIFTVKCSCGCLLKHFFRLPAFCDHNHIHFRGDLCFFRLEQTEKALEIKPAEHLQRFFIIYLAHRKLIKGHLYRRIRTDRCQIL